MTPPDQAAADARLAVLEEGHRNLAASIVRIETAQLAGMERLEKKLDRIETELVSRPTEAMARTVARMQAFAAASFTGLISAVIVIATST